MVDVKNPRCEEDGCKHQPVFGDPEDTKGRFCNKHKLPGMENVVGRRCEEDGCKRQPAFGDPDDAKARFCVKHKLPGMENVVSRRCEEEGCKRHPTFGDPDDTRRRFCNKHKQPGMEDVKNRRCEGEGCKRVPIFGDPDDTRGRFCNEHKQPGMEDVVNRRCEEEGCKHRPTFGDPDDAKARFCVKHKQPGMEDVANRRCEEEGCKRQPVFGDTDDTRRRFCNQHRQPGMVDVVTPRCTSLSCAQYDKFDRAPAGYHAPALRLAPSGEVVVEAGGKICYNCLGALFPDAVTLKVRQEHLVLAEVQRRLPELEPWFVSWDCSVPGGCSLRRPDMLWELPRLYLHLEVDEGGSEHEQSTHRLQQIQQAMGTHRPGFVLRVNPDGMLTKRQHSDGEHKYTATSEFERRMAELERFLRDGLLAGCGEDCMTMPVDLATLGEAVHEGLYVARLFF